MGRITDSYSHAVAAAKLLLPLLALGVMSALFLASRPSQQGEPLPFPGMQVDDLAREQKLGAPTFSGMTESGTRVSLSSERVYPDGEADNLLHTIAPTARLLTPEGTQYDIRADRGEIDQSRNITTFQDGVSIETSTGYVMYTRSMEIAGDLSRLASPSEVRVTGPLGQLTAGGMEITQDPETGTSARAVFTGGVRLLYTPKS